jgi:hypothetical protein
MDARQSWTRTAYGPSDLEVVERDFADRGFRVQLCRCFWIIEYFGEYIRRHGSVPRTLVTKELVGIAMPIFYGGKFYAASGVISSFLGSAIAFRIVAFLAVFTQFLAR